LQAGYIARLELAAGYTAALAAVAVLSLCNYAFAKK
jgi:hypothetical protein